MILKLQISSNNGNPLLSADPTIYLSSLHLNKNAFSKLNVNAIAQTWIAYLKVELTVTGIESQSTGITTYHTLIIMRYIYNNHLSYTSESRNMQSGYTDVVAKYISGKSIALQCVSMLGNTKHCFRRFIQFTTKVIFIRQSTAILWLCW